MDIRMPGMDGMEATQMITAGGMRARVLVLTTFDDDDYLYGALRAGASGFLVKDMALDDILTAIRVVAAGDAIIAPGVARRLIGQFASQPRAGHKPRELTDITDREREVLRLVGLGMSNAEIAAARTSAQAPPKRTWPGSWPSWTPGTGYSSSSAPTRQA
jgi:DNA-binding NarL/FixJ family response regulator